MMLKSIEFLEPRVRTGVEHNLWKYFRWKFSVLINRAYLFRGNAFLEEISEELPAEVVNNNAVRVRW